MVIYEHFKMFTIVYQIHYHLVIKLLTTPKHSKSIYSHYFVSTYKKVSMPSLNFPVIESFYSINNFPIKIMDVVNELDNLYLII